MAAHERKRARETALKAEVGMAGDDVLPCSSLNACWVFYSQAPQACPVCLPAPEVYPCSDASAAAFIPEVCHDGCSWS